MRGHSGARDCVNALGPFSISAITYMELLQGLRNKAELQTLRRFIVAQRVTMLSIDPQITSRAIELLEGYALSHGLTLGDAILAATVAEHGEALLTANESHYRRLPGLAMQRFRP